MRSGEAPALDIDGDEVGRRQHPAVLDGSQLDAPLLRVGDAASDGMLEDNVGHFDANRGRDRLVIVATEQAAVGVEPEALNAAVDRKAGAVVGLQLATCQLRPPDVGPEELVGQGEVAPKGVPRK